MGKWRNIGEIVECKDLTVQEFRKLLKTLPPEYRVTTGGGNNMKLTADHNACTLNIEPANNNNCETRGFKKLLNYL